MGNWGPWRQLRARNDIDLVLVDELRHGLRALHVTDGEHTVILIDRRLPPAERLAALAHELVHEERGGGCDQPGAPAAWDAVVAREERRVDDEVARRLVPPEDLRAWLQRRLEVADGVTVHDVADEFEVAHSVALDALRLLEGAA